MKTEKPEKGAVYESMKAAAGTNRWSLRVLKAAKDAGCPAFRGNRVYSDELNTWLKAHPEIKKLRKADDLKGSKLREEIRKLKLANDLKEGRLIERAWMAERVHIAAGKVDGFRHKSESEHPLLFAEAAGDVAACRVIVRKIWDEVLMSLNSLAADFKEPANGASQKGSNA